MFFFSSSEFYAFDLSLRHICHALQESLKNGNLARDQTVINVHSVVFILQHPTRKNVRIVVQAFNFIFV